MSEKISLDSSGTLYNFVLRYKYKVEIAFSEKTSAIIRQKRMHKS